jgi:hypothetical protein
MFASLYAPHRANTQHFQRRVIQLAGIVLLHATFESHTPSLVKKKSADTYGLINRPAIGAPHCRHQRIRVQISV